MKLQNLASGVVVSVRDDHPFTVDSDWGPVGGNSVSDRSENPDKSWKVADLKAYAEEQGIDLGDATKKEDILAVLAGNSGDSE